MSKLLFYTMIIGTNFRLQSELVMINFENYTFTIAARAKLPEKWDILKNAKNYYFIIGISDISINN